MTKETRQEIAEIWALFRENAHEIRALGQQIKEQGKQIGGLGRKFGGFTEGMALPSMERILRRRFKIDNISARVKALRNGRVMMEVDVLAYSNGRDTKVFVVEIKSRLRDEDIQEMVKKLKHFPRCFPQHGGKALYGIVCAVNIAEAMQRKVVKEGLYLALIRDDTFTMKVPKGFKAKRFH